MQRRQFPGAIEGPTGFEAIEPRDQAQAPLVCARPSNTLTGSHAVEHRLGLALLGLLERYLDLPALLRRPEIGATLDALMRTRAIQHRA